MAGFRKRTYAGAFGKSTRTVKRRRTSRFKKRGRNSVAFSTQSGSGTSLRFKSKKLSRKTWNRKLWDSTLQKTHWRSNGSVAGVINTAATQGQITIGRVQAMDNGSGPWWTQAGGTIEANAGDGVPIFGDDLVIRGGMIGMKVFNSSTTLPIQVKLYLIKDAPRPTVTNVPAAAPYGWDPSLVPEFTKDVGKIIFSKEFQLETLAEMTVERRIGIMKIDQEAWATDQQRFTWLITVGDPIAVSNVACQTVNYFNLSFVGDSVGTT